jgi:Xaa-Pro aminopeptidase
METPGYSLAERDRRWALARQIMVAENVQALIAYGGPGCTGMPGFAPDAYFSNDRPGSVLIFCRDAGPVQLVWSNLPVQTHLEAARRGEAMWIDPENIRAGPAGQPGNNAAGIAEVLREHRLERAAVGVLGPEAVPLGDGSPVMTYPLWRDVLAALPGVTFKPVGQSFIYAVICQSPEELAVVGHCAAAGDAAARAMLAAAAPGMTEAEVCAAGMAAAVRRGCQASMLMWSGPGFVAWGPPSWSYRPEPPRTLNEGDVLLAEVASRSGMKETRHQVAIAVGDPHPDIETAAVIAHASYAEGLRAARVGNSFGDLAEAMLAPLKQADSWPIHPLVRALNPSGPVTGFGRGLDQVPQARRYGRLAETPTVGSGLPLAPGMTWALCPSAVIGARAVSLGATVVIGEDDPVELSPLTTRLLRARGARPLTPSATGERHDPESTSRCYRTVPAAGGLVS